MVNKIREATVRDGSGIVKLVWELAQSMGETSPLTEEYVATYLGSATNRILLAEEQGVTLGLLSYSLRPNLYHSGNVCLIEELIVAKEARGRGIGTQLLSELLTRITPDECMEISVSTLPDNHRAIEFYRKHGFTVEGTLLEIHLANERIDE